MLEWHARHFGSQMPDPKDITASLSDERVNGTYELTNRRHYYMMNTQRELDKGNEAAKEKMEYAKLFQTRNPAESVAHANLFQTRRNPEDRMAHARSFKSAQGDSDARQERTLHLMESPSFMSKVSQDHIILNKGGNEYDWMSQHLNTGTRLLQMKDGYYAVMEQDREEKLDEIITGLKNDKQVCVTIQVERHDDESDFEVQLTPYGYNKAARGALKTKLRELIKTTCAAIGCTRGSGATIARSNDKGCKTRYCTAHQEGKTETPVEEYKRRVNESGLLVLKDGKYAIFTPILMRHSDHSKFRWSECHDDTRNALQLIKKAHDTAQGNRLASAIAAKKAIRKLMEEDGYTFVVASTKGPKGTEDGVVVTSLDDIEDVWKRVYGRGKNWRL